MIFLYIACVDLSIENADSRHVIEVCDNLIKQGHDVTLMVPNIARCPQKVDFSIKYVPTLTKSVFFNYAFFYIEVIPYLLSFFIRQRPHVVYSRFMPTEFPVMILAKLLPAQYVIEINGAGAEELKLKNSSTFLVWVSHIGYWLGCHMADSVIVVTEGLRDHYINTYSISGARIHSIENGVDVERIQPHERRECKVELQLDDSKRYIVFVGSLQVWHGVDRFIEIMVLLKKKHDDVVLLIAGDGPFRKELEKRVMEKGLENYIRILGKIENKRIPLYVGASELCLAPYPATNVSSLGLAPLKIREYMACGRPIVTTDVGGLKTFVQNNGCGIAISENTNEEFAQTIARLLEDQRSRTIMGDRARKFAVESLSWAKTAQRILDKVG